MENVKKYDCVVIGGGAAGMMAAITAATKGAHTAVIEHKDRLGIKILQTGNGKCNFTNLNMDISNFQNDNKKFVSRVYSEFTNLNTLDFFEKCGVYNKNRNGYVYPNSETASCIQENLIHELIHKKADIYTDTYIEDMKKQNDEFIIKVIVTIKKVNSQENSKKDSNKKNRTLNGKSKKNQIEILRKDKITIKSKKIILCTGSKAAYKTGSDGSGYEYAKKFGHTIKKPLPALVQLYSDNGMCKNMAGVRSSGTVRIYSDQELLAEDTGEIQYTELGISGIPVFQVSRFAVEKLDKKKKVKAVIDMLPGIDTEKLIDECVIRMKDDPEKNNVDFFSGLLNKKLVYAVVKDMGINCEEKIQKTGIKNIKKIINTFKQCEFNITGSKDFEFAQVCQGGVVLDEINPKTMESEIVKGLYFAGEITDVDGKCGGYNLQWAWSSGYVAGRSAAQKNL